MPTRRSSEAADAEAVGVERGAAGQRDEPGGRAVELVERERPFALGRAQLHARDQAAEVAIALGGFAEDGEHHGKSEG